MRILLVGTEGVGKTTFAADAPAPVFLAAERGLELLNKERVARGADAVPGFPAPKNWAECLEAIDTLVRDPHEFRTLVLDTVDWMEHHLYVEIQRRTGMSDKEMEEYGRWGKIAVEDWRKLLRMVEVLQERRGMHVVALAHAGLGNFKNPSGEDYQRWKPKLYGDACPAVWKEWADAVLFATYELTFYESGGKTKAETTGNRVLYTTWTPAHDAKNRYGLPEVLPLDWAEFVAAKDLGSPASAAALQLSCERLLEQLADETSRTQARAFVVAHAQDATTLARTQDRLRFLLNQQKKGAQQA